MLDSRSRLATHPISTLNKLILGVKKDLPLALSLKKKRYSKEQLIEHLVMLGQAKLIDLSKIPALKKKAMSKSAAAIGVKSGDKLPYKKKAKPAASKSAAAIGVKSGDKLPYKKKAKPATHSMPDGTKMTGKTHTASSKPVAAKPKKLKDEMTLHKKQLKDDIREMKKFLKRKTPVDSRSAINGFEGRLEVHQRELDEALEERGGRKLGYSEVFNATKELVKEHGDLFNEVEKKINDLRKRFEEAEAKKPLSKAMKAMLGGGAEALDKAEAKKKAKKAKKPKKEKSPPAPPPVPEETPEERKVRVKARQKKIIKKLKERGPPKSKPSAAQLAARKKFGDAAKERSAEAKKRQDVIDNTTVSYGVYKYKKKPKKV